MPECICMQVVGTKPLLKSACSWHHEQNVDSHGCGRACRHGQRRCESFHEYTRGDCRPKGYIMSEMSTAIWRGYVCVDTDGDVSVAVSACVAHVRSHMCESIHTHAPLQNVHADINF